ncbi:GNAT family N-acetyltransferase [Phaeacidiphilus oryzae]|uniref:GNAT family N-acetyltransferase n=1 Tax=Phaeacidiphilus oryzae TaxID=348818 RepID=UPI00056B3CF6|nr:GNAT family N-acetyltransferase [Phaeacidiphilus oryzae]
MSADPIIRPITADELEEWGRAVNTGFLRSHPEGDLDLAFRREFFEPGRSLGAFDRDRVVGTFRSMRRDITVPGGAAVVADAVTNVIRRSYGTEHDGAPEQGVG